MLRNRSVAGRNIWKGNFLICLVNARSTLTKAKKYITYFAGLEQSLIREDEFD